MTCVYDSAFIELKNAYDKINVVDVGAARGAFLVELEKIFKLEDVYAIGIDPFNYPVDNGYTLPEDIDDSHRVMDHYDKFFQICVDNVESPTKKEFFINSDFQTSSLCKLQTENLSTDLNDKNKFYYSQSILDKITQIQEVVEVDVLNLDTLINEELPEGIVHFIKIDTEGKDLNIVKSLSDDTLGRTKFICIECPNFISRFEGEANKQECVDYFESKNFKVFNFINYEEDLTNRQPMSDVVFINGEDV